jgi:hypothetical protein
MDTREVVARFVAERQALALMDHPNIARVLDCSRVSKWKPPRDLRAARKSEKSSCFWPRAPLGCLLYACT